MEARVPIMVKDRMMEQYGAMEPTESFTIHAEDFFLNGPVTRRVAVVDLDPVTGDLVTGCCFEAPGGAKKFGAYRISDGSKPDALDFMQASVFGTVLKAMYMFEDADALGRRLTWAFNGTQLLVVPRAGVWANAYYERESHSLQLFYIEGTAPDARPIYSSLSHDIVSHETAHAILDGIAPDLYHAVTPQSLAIHEAVADLTALILALKSKVLPRYVLDHNGGSIHDSTVFCGIAPEFQQARDPSGQRRYLRNLLNDKSLDPALADEFQNPNHVNRSDPHGLSEVLSGAFYTVLVKGHDALKAYWAPRRSQTEFQVSGYALFLAAERMKRMLFRALDYLPPGEVSFADYGRAILASDAASHPGDGTVRDWIAEEFVRRFIVTSRADLEVPTNYEHSSLTGMDLQNLVDSDWIAYEYANQNREFLNIPPGVPFQVRPRLDVTKSYYLGGSEPTRIRECLFKVSWSCQEPNASGAFGAAQRLITAGTTLAIDWNTRKVRAKLTTDSAEGQRQDRDAVIQNLQKQLAQGVPVRTEMIGGVLRVRATARMLHIHATAGRSPTAPATRPTPPPGVDASVFYNLLDSRAGPVTSGGHQV